MNRGIMRTFATLALLLVAGVTASAQRFDSDDLWNTQPPTDTTFRRVFLLPQFGTGLHLASNLECLDGGGCTPFTGGSGSFTSLGVGLDQVISLSFSGIAMLSLNLWDVSMTSTDGAARVRMPDGSITNLVRELTMQANGMTLGVSFGALFQSGAFWFTITPVIDIALGQRWSQQGRILSPAGIAYPDGSTTAVIVPDVAIPNAATMRFGASGSAGYEIQLNEQYSIVPTISAQFMPTAIRSGSSWADFRLTGGIALRREANDLPDTLERVRTFPNIDTIFVTRQSEVAGKIFIAGPADVRADTVVDRLLKKITVTIRRTDTLVTLDPSTAIRLAEERRQAEEQRVKEEEERLRAEKAQRIAEEKKFEEKTPKAVISIAGKSKELKPKRKLTVAFDTVGTSIRVNRDTTRSTELNYYITEGGDTVFTDNVEVAEELAISLTSERQELTFMVLPSVFFDSTSAAIPGRYRQLTSTQDYEPGKGVKGQLEVNLDILNIIGSRLSKASSSVIVRGYADGTSEAASCDLARQRANAVAEYLTQRWEIPAGRIRVAVGTGSCAPDPASAGNTNRGREENRRVEILSDDLEYFQPVEKVTVVVKPVWDVSNANLQFGDTTDPVVSWVTIYRQGNRVIETRRGTGPFDQSSLSLSNAALDSLTKQPIILTFAIKTQSGQESETDLKIPVETFEKDIKFENLSLAMFAVRSTELGKRDEELLRTFASRLDPGDRVAVLGYSDDLGNAAKNMDISTARAAAVARRLRQLRPDCEVTRIEGFGNTRFPIGVTSYETPEQRFMSRTVQLVLEKK